MTIALLIIAAVASYLICSINPAIVFSKLIYHKDIRTQGSGNPGFTNFKRVYGMKFAWLVFLIDISKAILLELLFGFLFAKFLNPQQAQEFAETTDVVTKNSFWAAQFATERNLRLFGIAFSGAFCMLGHTIPVWYGFKGGKGFLVCISTLYMIDWKCGLFATIMLCIFLFSTHYMSLATIIAMVAGTVLLPFMKVPLFPDLIFAGCVAFMIYRHHENIKRLATGTEKKFYFFKKKTEKKEQDSAQSTNEPITATDDSTTTENSAIPTDNPTENSTQEGN